MHTTFARLLLSISALTLLLLGMVVSAASDNGQQTQQNLFVTNTPAAPAQPIAEPTAQPQTSALDDTEVVTSASSQIVVQGEPVTLSMPDECAYVPGQSTSQACIDFMNAYPEPPVRQINQDGYTLSQYSFWRVGPEPVNKYAAPGGAVSGVIPQGFNFVNAINSSVDGWIQIEGGEWLRRSDGYNVPASRFTGVRLPENWRLPFGWILDITGIYASLYPGGPSTSESGLVPLHYERYNIYAEAVGAEGWTWYLVGPDQWVKQIHMTVIKPVERPENVTGRWMAIDLFEQSLVAYEGNTPVFATLVSTGLPGTETNEGIFDVWARLARDGMSGATGAPNAYALQSVPWVLYFDDSISLHGTYWHDTFGYRRSRGCVNLSISDANWVFNWTAQTPANADGTITNQVYVYSSGEYRSA
jgi:hypothetical protein